MKERLRDPSRANRALARRSALLLVLVAAACRDGSGNDDGGIVQGTAVQAVVTGEYTFTVPLPGALVGPAIDGVAEELTIVATNSLKLNDRVRTTGGTARTPVLFNAGTGPTYIGADAVVNGSIRAGGAVELRDRARVNGNLTASGRVTRGNQTYVSGTVRAYQPPPTITQFRFVVEFPAATCNPGFEVPPNGALSISPGSYGAVVVKPGGRLTLAGGPYVLDSLEIHSDGSLVVDDTDSAVELFLREGFSFKGRVIEAGNHPAEFVVATPTTGTVFIEAPFTGTLIAPNAGLALQTVASHLGTLVGKNVELQAGVQFTQSGFPGYSGLAPAEDVLGTPPPQPVIGPPPPLAGQADPSAALAAFVPWHLQSTANEQVAGITAVQAARGDPALVAAVVQRADALRDSGELIEALAVLGILGELRSAAGEAHFSALLDAPLPPDHADPSEATEAFPHPPALMRRLSLLRKAVQGLAYMGTTSARLKVLAVAATFPETSVRAEAVRAYLANYGEVIGRTELLGVLRPEEAILVDRPEMIGVSGHSYDESLALFLAAHPEAVPPPPAPDPDPEPDPYDCSQP